MAADCGELHGPAFQMVAYVVLLFSTVTLKIFRLIKNMVRACTTRKLP